ncbi:hypothetical protein [Sulfurimonas microaerophilic]|uniref:hypothetical protein n=1 Tax=Sulfurimonas microaerophilic TaxID=3058392 RepID=UPI002714A1F1|nr:hypothetical protein [Sulfurimonas sp. hsl 1-7]
MKKYLQTKNLPEIFDLSIDYFQQRMHTEFIKGIHFFIPPTNSKTKKAVLWDIEALENWLKGYEQNDELENLLARRG